MTALRWDKAVAAGVVTDAEADLLRECVWVDDDDTWHITLTGLTEHQCERLERAVMWFTSKGGMQ